MKSTSLLDEFYGAHVWLPSFFAAQYPNPVTGWQPYQALITRFYKDEDRPLAEVMQIMESQYSFKAT